MFKDTLSINKFLCHETSSGKHGKTTILQLLGLHKCELSRVFRLEAKRVKANVTRNVVGTQKTGLVNRDILWCLPSNLGTLDFGLCNSGTQEEPKDGVDLGKVSDGRSRNLAIEQDTLGLDSFANEETKSGKHGNTTMGELGLTVTLQSVLISLFAKAQGIKESNGLKSTRDVVNGEALWIESNVQKGQL